MYAAIFQFGSYLKLKGLSLSQKKKSIPRQNNSDAISNWPLGMLMVIKYHEWSNATYTSTLNWHLKSGRQPCESSGRMESVSSPLRPFLALGADKFRNIVMSTNTFCFEAWIDNYSTVHTRNVVHHRDKTQSTAASNRIHNGLIQWLT